MTPASSSPRTLPSVVDLARIVFGLAIFLFVSFTGTTPPPGYTSVPYGMLAVAAVILFAIVLGVPAYLLRGRRGDWRGFARFCGNGLLIFAGMALAGLVLRGRPPRAPALVDSLRTGTITIDGFLRAQRAAAPRAFDLKFVGQRTRDLRASGLDPKNVELLEVTDGSWWMRTKLGFMTPLPQQPGTEPARWRQIVFYHARGAAVLVSICSKPATDCSGLDRTLDTADRNLRERVAAGDLDYVLPEDGYCTIETVNAQGVPGQARVRACNYGPGLVMTFMRLDSATTIADLASSNMDTP
jgi:hypothetical protein